jgi:hypothetical protein
MPAMGENPLTKWSSTSYFKNFTSEKMIQKE